MYANENLYAIRNNRVIYVFSQYDFEKILFFFAFFLTFCTSVPSVHLTLVGPINNQTDLILDINR